MTARTKTSLLVAAALVIAAAAWLYFGSAAQAADLGGNCCADLEERISELEATTVRKGDRKVSLRVYGQVSKGLLYIDDGTNSDLSVHENSAAESLIGFAGEGRIDGSWKAGFVLELGLGGYDTISAGDGDNGIYTRRAALYVDGPAGRGTIGLASQATDGIAEISVANTEVASRLLSLRPLNGPQAGDALDIFDGTRGNLVRYDTGRLPLGGFSAAASWADGSGLAGNDDDVWDVALRYGGEFGGFKLAAGVGYRSGVIVPTFGSGGDVSVVSGSASAEHIASGIFVNVAAGHLDLGDTLDETVKAYHVQAGVEKKLFIVGKTTFFGEYGDLSVSDSDAGLSLWGGGIVQSFDGAALDLFINYRRLQLDSFGGAGDADVGMAGARIAF